MGFSMIQPTYMEDTPRYQTQILKPHSFLEMVIFPYLVLMIMGGLMRSIMGYLTSTLLVVIDILTCGSISIYYYI